MRKSGKQRTYKGAFLRFRALNEFLKGHPTPRYSGKRGSKLLKTKEWSAEKSAKRGERGGKLLRTWDLPQTHGDTEGRA